MPIINAPPPPGGAQSDRLYERVMECMGSRTNTANFVITHEDINAVKSNLMRGNNPIALDRLPGLYQDKANPGYVLTRLRAAIGLIRYLNYQGTPNVNQRLTNIINNAGEQWRLGQDQWNAANPGGPRVLIGDFWEEWTVDFFQWLISHTRDFVTEGIKQITRYWGVATNDNAPQVLEILRVFSDELTGLEIDTRGFDG